MRHWAFPKNDIDTTNFCKGAGCEECRMLGYQGRMGIYELLFMDEDIRSLIISRAASSTIAQKAMYNGMRTLRNDGWKKVKAGQDHHRRSAPRHPNRRASHGADRGPQNRSRRKGA